MLKNVSKMNFEKHHFPFFNQGRLQKEALHNINTLIEACVTLSMRYISMIIECYEQFWTSPGGNTPQNTSSMATKLPSRKLSKLDGPDMQDTAGEAGTSS